MVTKIIEKNKKLNFFEKIFYSWVEKLFENNFRKENKDNLFSGILAGFVVSIFIILIELFEELFKFFNIENKIFLIYLLFLFLFVVTIRKFSDYFLQIKKYFDL